MLSTLPHEIMTIEVFRTNVDTKQEAQDLIEVLTKLLNANLVTFDLEDCDRILRIVGNDFIPEEAVHVLNIQGFECEHLRLDF